jgi:signal transduction histidine kinase
MNPNAPRRETAQVPAAGGPHHYDQLVWAQEVFEFAPDPRLRTDGRGIILAANHAAAALLRCPKEFLVDKPLGLFIAEGRRGFYDHLNRLRQGSPGEAFETRVGRPGEHMRDVAVVVVPEYREHDNSHPVVVVFRWQLTDVTDRKRAEAARDELLKRLVTAQEDERRRISREMHDTFGQLLTALSLGVRAVRNAGPLTPEALDCLGAVEKIVAELHHAAHDLAVRLRPTTLDDLGLAAALGQFTEEWSRRTGIPVSYHKAATKAQRFPSEVETALYRVVQEALTNVAKHAGSTHVGVIVGRSDGHAVAVVEDDGCGFDPEAIHLPGGRRPLGLLGMRERVAQLGGTLEIESVPGAGTAIFARIPLPEVPGTRPD